MIKDYNTCDLEEANKVDEANVDTSKFEESISCWIQAFEAWVG